ncbi:MAG: hypothetical protein F6K10_33755 [Moorea sp. SIO2B7]|nr:hypothetical protein [Moorena sp. SIO2B7]
MNPQENQDWNRRLQELERELNQSSSPSSINQNNEDAETQPLPNNSQKIYNVVTSIENWFNSLPNVGKVAVVVVSGMLTLSLLSTVLRLVSALVSLSVLGIVLYFVYRFFTRSSTPE